MDTRRKLSISLVIFLVIFTLFTLPVFSADFNITADIAAGNEER